MKKIHKSELMHGDVYIEFEESRNIKVFLVPYGPNVLNPTSGLNNICASLHHTTTWFYDPSTEDGEVYLITTLRDIGEVIKEIL